MIYRIKCFLEINENIDWNLFIVYEKKDIVYKKKLPLYEKKHCLWKENGSDKSTRRQKPQA